MADSQRAEMAPAAALRLGDFDVTTRMLMIAGIAAGIGCLSAGIAWLLLRLIGFFTNVFYFQDFKTSLRSPSESELGALMLVVPVIGALVIGLMARYGSERIRGHGIPEALEAILIGDSKMDPRVMVLKPLSSAISIGSGGPFGAEGPIIMTGGAFGSIIGQFLHLTSTERKTLLVAGAAGGMSGTFSTPVAAVLLAVELLLFEWKPRSLIPVALSSASAAVVRHYILGSGPLFPVPEHQMFVGMPGVAGCVIAGLLAGTLAVVLTAGVYASEDAFGKLPIHWMWWPAIGGLVVGAGGLFFPEALGVGYSTIGDLLQGDTSVRLVAGVLLVKSTIWAVSLGSGTSGGVLAPLLMMGAALGGIESGFLPHEGAGFWPMVSMAAVLGGTMRSPFTAIVFTLELTGDFHALTPLLIAVVVAYAVTVLLMRRSILTEKVSRRGFHLSREYGVDPLELTPVRDIMQPAAVTLNAAVALSSALATVSRDSAARRQRLYPVINGDGKLAGVVTRSEVEAIGDGQQDGKTVSQIMHEPVVAYEREPARVVAYRMAASGHTRMPVLSSREDRSLVGMVSLVDLLSARARVAQQERRRERIFRVAMRRSPRTSQKRPASSR